MKPRERVARERREIALYFGFLMLTQGLADPLGIVYLPVLYTLKDTLELRPTSVAAFEAITLLPVYFGFLFGFLRDRWQPFGWGDRGYLFLSVPIAICGYLWLASNPVSYVGLLVAILLIAVAFQFMNTATEALLTSLAMRHQMTGRLSALSELADVFPGIVAVLLGGWMVAHASPRETFIAAALITTALGILALWNPASVFAKQSMASAAIEGNMAALRRLLRHRPLWPTVAILALWNFAPGWGTPFLYYLSDEIGLSSEVFSLCRAVNLGCVAATAILYGIVCRRQPLKRMLWWGTGVNVFPGFLFLLIQSTPHAVAVSAIVGLIFGMTNVALFDLLRRSCPKDLEGSGMMLGFSALTAAGTVADLVGSYVYEQGGFALCLVIDALLTLCIFPLLSRIPSSVIEAPDQNREDFIVVVPVETT